MIIFVFLALGLIFGSFINAVVWRVHEQELETAKKKPNRTYLDRLSIRKGRSMCSNCHHELAASDLVPLFSWLLLRGKCRYCKQPIPDSPIVEVVTAILFAVSYAAWPSDISTILAGIQFATWLGVLVGLIMLSVYDLRWMLLPNRLLYPTGVLGTVFASIAVWNSPEQLKALISLILAIAVGGGVFFVLFQLSQGRWIGGGDVKLGWVLGLLVLTPAKAVLFIFLAALMGTIVSVPLVYRNKLKRSSVIPFGPFLIAGAYITVLWGAQILDWYTGTLIGR